MSDQLNSLVVGSNYPAINSSDVKGLTIYCPDHTEQERIAAVLNATDRMVENLERPLNKLREEKQALLQQLLTGRRRLPPRDAAPEPRRAERKAAPTGAQAPPAGVGRRYRADANGGTAAKPRAAPGRTAPPARRGGDPATLSRPLNPGLGGASQRPACDNVVAARRPVSTASTPARGGRSPPPPAPIRRCSPTSCSSPRSPRGCAATASSRTFR
ncbi:restriction endonuclease subunit S domain-containing protein [Endothiovibrio diazotrophicus]